MATALDIVRLALMDIGEYEAGETLSAEDAKDGTTMLNNMLHGWKLKDIDIQHVTVAQSDTLRVPDEYLLGIQLNLAVLLAPQYGATTPPEVANEASNQLVSIRAATMEYTDDLKVDKALDVRYSDRRLGRYNIDEG